MIINQQNLFNSSLFINTLAVRTQNHLTDLLFHMSTQKSSFNLAQLEDICESERRQLLKLSDSRGRNDRNLQPTPQISITSTPH